MEPRAFGKYTLLHRIARGGMADLFLARSRDVAGIERLLVIKVVASRYSLDPTFTSMFEDEVRIAANLSHPNIGQVIDVGQEDGVYFLAMEYIHGRDMRQVLRRCMENGEPVPVKVALPMAVRICSALHHAHEARGLDGRPLNIVHRDVSPSNIMVTYDGVVKLVDFGIAKAANRTALTVPGTIKGKLRYLSPEQVLGRPLDRRTDVFGMGVCLWETTVGRHCFEGAADARIYEAIIKGDVRPPSSFIQSYPPELERILLRALSVEPEKRHQSAQALQLDLEKFAAQAGIALSDLSLSNFMHQVFGAEVAAWERAQRHGKSLVQHLQELAAQSEQKGEHVVLVAGPGSAGSTPPSASSALPLQTLPPPSQEDLLERARTRPPSSEQRRTIMYGERRGQGAVPAPAATEIEPPSASGTNSPSNLQVSRAKPVEVRLDGRGEMVPSSESAPSEDRRRTVIVGTGLLAPPGADQRPTVMHTQIEAPVRPAPIRPAAASQSSAKGSFSTGPASPRSPSPTSLRSDPLPHARLPAGHDTDLDRRATVLEEQRPVVGSIEVMVQLPTDAPDLQQQGLLPERTTEPDAIPSGVQDKEPDELPKTVSLRQPAPEPVMVRDRTELEARRRQQATEPDDDETSAVTGDWSAQANRERRAGPHPYFDGADDLDRPPRNVLRLVLILLPLGLLLAGTVIYLGLRQSRRVVVPPASSRDAGVSLAVAIVETRPSGATVFGAQDGRELGTTPLMLKLPPNRRLDVEIQLAGHRRQRLSIERAGRHQVTLIAEKPKSSVDAKLTPPETTKPEAKKPEPKKLEARKLEAKRLEPRKPAPKRVTVPRRPPKQPPPKRPRSKSDLVNPFD